MASININLPAVRKQAKLLKEASQKLSSGTVKTITEANEQVGRAWTGGASQKFVKYMDELAKLLKSNAKSLDDISVFLTEACSSIEKADAQAKAKIK